MADGDVAGLLLAAAESCYLRYRRGMVRVTRRESKVGPVWKGEAGYVVSVAGPNVTQASVVARRKGKGSVCVMPGWFALVVRLRAMSGVLRRRMW
jgi:hypothetical protein